MGLDDGQTRIPTYLSHSYRPDLLAVESRAADLDGVIAEIGAGPASARPVSRLQGRPVFISNAGADNDAGRDLVDRLRSYDIRLFHYIYENTIPPGEQWRTILPTKIEESSVFVALIGKSYWDSPLCQQEYAIALDLHRQGRLTLMPCFLEPSDADIGAPRGSLADLHDPHRGGPRLPTCPARLVPVR